MRRSYSVMFIAAVVTLVSLAANAAQAPPAQKKDEVNTAQGLNQPLKLSAKQLLALANCKAVSRDTETLVQAALDGKLYKGKPIQKRRDADCKCIPSDDPGEPGNLFCKDENGNYQYAGDC